MVENQRPEMFQNPGLLKPRITSLSPGPRGTHQYLFPPFSESRSQDLEAGSPVVVLPFSESRSQELETGSMLGTVWSWHVSIALAAFISRGSSSEGTSCSPMPAVAGMQVVALQAFSHGHGSKFNQDMDLSVLVLVPFTRAIHFGYQFGPPHGTRQADRGIIWS